MTAEDIAKTIAFQIGQMFALLTENIELYTKDEISKDIKKMIISISIIYSMVTFL